MKTEITKREYDVLRLLPLDNKDIAKRLYLSPLTVVTHVNNLRFKLGASSKVKLLALALKEQKINIGEIITE